ncbi:unnamed protein product [Prorocentrum cordatum]|uniref:Uncharacterized protein n=1 Tax=Prorocentrum cordatum TaxID=2364126 RepID=A0ABN9WW11_9DINO|nr:unnamed protein product [Polarella glacialis]
MAQRTSDEARGWQDLRASVAELEKHVAALCACLNDAGVLQEQTLLARLHRHRFAAAVQRHPCTWDASLQQALRPTQLLDCVLRLAGQSTALSLCMASTDLSLGAADLRRSRLAPARLYVCGGQHRGFQSLRSAECFDTARGTWELLPPMTEQRADLAAASAGGRLYVCGGRPQIFRGECLDSAECFDPAVGAWAPLPPMAEARSRTRAAVLQGLLYVVGGYSGSEFVASAERLDPATGRWEALPRMSAERADPAVAVLGGRLYVCGGFRAEPPESLACAERLDPGAAAPPAWEALPEMHARRAEAVAAPLLGHLYVCGGWCQGERLRGVDRLAHEHPAAGWRTLPPMLERRCAASAAAIGGRLYVYGGRGPASAERFDPALDAWEALPAPAGSRSLPLAAVAAGCL